MKKFIFGYVIPAFFGAGVVAMLLWIITLAGNFKGW